jgi:hypothetical protein
MSTLRANTVETSSRGAVTLTKQEAAKAWFHYNQSSEEVRDSFNTSSITDDSTGIYTNVFTNNMGNAFYGVNAGTRGNRNQFNTDTGATTGRAYRTADSNNAVADADSNCWTTMGDLA